MTSKEKKPQESLIYLFLLLTGPTLTIMGYHILNRNYHPYTLQSDIAQYALIGSIFLIVGLISCVVLIVIFVSKRRSFKLK